MFNQTPDENAIDIAISNITQLYDQISKIINEMDVQLKVDSLYPNLNNPNSICRWRTDSITNISGWQVLDIVRPYCSISESEDVEKNSKQIVIHIHMAGKIPYLSFGLFTYEKSITDRNFGVGDHWLMYFPFTQNKNFDLRAADKYLILSKVTNDKSSRSYNGIIDNTFATIRLLNINNSETLNKIVIQPALELFNNGIFTIDSSISDSFITSEDYFTLLK